MEETQVMLSLILWITLLYSVLPNIKVWNKASVTRKIYEYVLKNKGLPNYWLSGVTGIDIMTLYSLKVG